MTYYCNLCHKNTPDPLYPTWFATLEVCWECVKAIHKGMEKSWQAAAAERMGVKNANTAP